MRTVRRRSSQSRWPPPPGTRRRVSALSHAQGIRTTREGRVRSDAGNGAWSRCGLAVRRCSRLMCGPWCSSSRSRPSSADVAMAWGGSSLQVGGTAPGVGAAALNRWAGAVALERGATASATSMFASTSRPVLRLIGAVGDDNGPAADHQWPDRASAAACGARPGAVRQAALRGAAGRPVES